jgi:poly(hydroxyalkanoate) depolymerase family esterase
MATRQRVALSLAAGVALGCASVPGGGPVEMQSERGTFTSAEGSRAYVVARPLGGGAARGRPMVVVLHGCVQSADDIARGTRMTEVAAHEGFVVLYPEQPASANLQRCWNWYLPAQTTRGSGEVALLAAMIDSIGRREGADPNRVAVMGMSAGAAMAASLVVAYPERFAALAMHSGVAAGAAVDVGSALAVMAKGPANGDALGDAALAAMGVRARPVPVIVLHGAADKVVSPANLPAAAAQWTRVNTRAPGRGAPVEQHLLEGVGHAWSGGAAAGSYTAPQGPDATGLIVAFFRRIGLIGG